MDLVTRWLEGWRLCRGLDPAIEYDDALAVVLRLPGRERELFARDDDTAPLNRLATQLPAAAWLTVTTQHGDEVARRLEELGVRPFAEHKTLMSIDLADRQAITTASPPPTPAGAGSPVPVVMGWGSGPLEYVRVLVDETVAAHGMMAIVGEDAVMHDIHTDPAFRRRGLGSVVMGALGQRALERGARTGPLMATTDGYHLYRKLGWLPEATMVTASGDPRAVGGDLGAVLAGR